MPGCTRDQIESQAAAIAESSYNPMLAHAKLGRVASVSPHCCDSGLPKAAQPLEVSLAGSARPEHQEERPVKSGLQGRSGERRVLPPTSPFSGAPVSAAQNASGLPLVLSARDLLRETQQVSHEDCTSVIPNKDLICLGSEGSQRIQNEMLTLLHHLCQLHPI